MTAIAINILSATFIKHRRFHTLSVAVSGLNFLIVPVGTALGLYTFIVLTKDSVQRKYAEVAGINLNRPTAEIREDK